uniref:Uncharacterized protein n=1 Tax=Solanum tuberosum TaxID=4113 RepID=M1DC91_SOLTU
MNDHGSDNDSHYGQNDNMVDLNDMHMNIIQTAGAIQEMTQTKGKKMVTSDNEIDRDSPLPPPPKKQKGISINEPLEAPRAQQTNPQIPTNRGKKVRNNIATKQVNECSKIASPPQDPNYASHVLP